MPFSKELHYFDEMMHGIPVDIYSRLFDKRNNRWRIFAKLALKRSIRRRKEVFGKLRQELKFLFGRPCDAWYESCFSPRAGQIAGECTPDYAYLDEQSLIHIKELVPSAKVIYVLRNPIVRSWSSAMMWFRNNGKLPEVLDKADFINFFKSDMHLQHGDYMSNIERWRKFYPWLKICFFDDIKLNHELFLVRVFKFLGVDDSTKHITPLAGKVIHAGRTSVIPTFFRRYLAEMHMEQLISLNKIFGGHVLEWLSETQETRRQTPSLRLEKQSFAAEIS